MTSPSITTTSYSSKACKTSEDARRPCQQVVHIMPRRQEGVSNERSVLQNAQARRLLQTLEPSLAGQYPLTESFPPSFLDVEEVSGREAIDGTGWCEFRRSEITVPAAACDASHIRRGCEQSL